MKFKDGNWLLREGFRAHYATEVDEADLTDGVLTLGVPTRHIRHRGDTLEGPVLTLRLSAPRLNVIRVQASHFEGRPQAGPHFELCAPGPAAHGEVGPERLCLRSGDLSVYIDRASCTLEFRHGERVLTRVPTRGLAYLESPKGPHMTGALSLGVGENVYGLGERFTAFVKNGQVVEVDNRDGGTGSEQAYKNVPFYLSSAGYGVFVNQPERVSFEVASEQVSRVQFSVPGERLDFCVVAGEDPREVLSTYTALTGRPALPPAWSFGLWLSTSFTTNYDEATVQGFLDGMHERELPLSVFHFDCFWMRPYRWCDFEWDPAVFPDPQGMLARLHARGLKVCVWINPYIAQRSPLFEEGRAGGYLLRRPDGSVWQWDLWQPGMAIVDFTNPAARAWYAGKLRALLDMGVDCFKTDFGERIPSEGVVWHDGSDPGRMHNYYAQLYNQTVYELLQERGAAVVFARAATAGGQRFPVHWGGDNDSSFESMAESLRGGLSLGLCGFGFWSHDIGGFEGDPPADVYKRWVAFGLLSSHSRLHASTSYRVPWRFDEEAVQVLRHFTTLKYRLMPYLYAQAVQAREHGLPMMRAMLLEFPQDPACLTLDRQYLLGESLLVAPVFSAAGEVRFYVPEGRWTDLQSGEVICGPRWASARHDYFGLPLLVRPGTLLVTGARQDRPDYDHGEHPTLTLYALEDGQSARAELYTLQGSPDFRVTVTREGNHLRLRREGAARPFHLRVAGSDRTWEMEGMETERVLEL